MLELPSTHLNALLLCVRYVNLSCIKDLLLKFKLDFSITDLFDNSVLHLIMMREFGEDDKIEVLKLFYDNGNWRGMSFNAENIYGQTVLDLVTVEENELDAYITQAQGKRSAPKVITTPILPAYSHYASSPSSPSETRMEIASSNSEGGPKKNRFPL